MGFAAAQRALALASIVVATSCKPGETPRIVQKRVVAQAPASDNSQVSTNPTPTVLPTQTPTPTVTPEPTSTLTPEDPSAFTIVGLRMCRDSEACLLEAGEGSLPFFLVRSTFDEGRRQWSLPNKTISLVVAGIQNPKPQFKVSVFGQSEAPISTKTFKDLIRSESMELPEISGPTFCGKDPPGVTTETAAMYNIPSSQMTCQVYKIVVECTNCSPRVTKEARYGAFGRDPSGIPPVQP